MFGIKPETGSIVTGVFKSMKTIRGPD